MASFLVFTQLSDLGDRVIELFGTEKTGASLSLNLFVRNITLDQE